MFKEFIECDKCKKMREILKLKDNNDINFYEKIVIPVLEKNGTYHYKSFKVDLCENCYKEFISEIDKLIKKFNLMEMTN